MYFEFKTIFSVKSRSSVEHLFLVATDLDRLFRPSSINLQNDVNYLNLNLMNLYNHLNFCVIKYRPSYIVLSCPSQKFMFNIVSVNFWYMVRVEKKIDINSTQK